MRRLPVILVCVLAASAGGAAPTVRRGHPRIYVTPADVPKIKARCAGPMRELFARMRKAEHVMKGRAAADWSGAHNVGYPAFMYLVTAEKRYLDKTAEFLEAFAAGQPRDKFLAGEWLGAAPPALDWVWNDLPDEKRRRYAGALLETAEWILRRVWRHSDFSNQFVYEHLAVLHTAVLLDGEGIEPKRVARLLKAGTAYLLEHAMPAADEIAGPLRTPAPAGPLGRFLADAPHGQQADACFVGGQAEGFSYNDWGYARPLALTCEMWRVATGQDLFAESSFFRGQSVWHAYGIRPDTGTYARSEDCPSGIRPGANLKSYLHLLAARLADPLAEHLAGRIKWKYPQAAWREILWRDPMLAGRSPRQLGLPKAACFPKLGHVYFRTSWGDSRAAFALFQCGPFYAGHQHLDNNSFVIHRSGSLAIDAGTNEYAGHRANYYCRTIAHNAMLVFDPREVFGAGVWSGRGRGGSNDGGQLRPAGLSRIGQFQPGGPADTGRLVAFANGKLVAGCVGDATASYSPAKVRRAVRAFYHLRSPKPGPEATDTFVVYDAVTTLRDLPAKWVIHSIDRPRTTGRQFLITRGEGQLAGEIIRPRDVELRLVGGPGRESTVNGVNYPPVQRRRDREAGGWRIEAPFTSEMLVLLHAGPKTGRMPQGALVAIGGGRIVAKVPRGGIVYRLTLDGRRSGVPIVEVLQGDKVVETLKLPAPPAR